MNRILPTLLLPLLAACDDVGPIATKGATRLAWEAGAKGPGWAATIDNPLASLTVDGRAESGPITYKDGRNGRTFHGQFGGEPYTLLLSAGPCALGPEGSPKTYEFHARLTLGERVLDGCASRGWLMR
ncbi:hypothetical protein OU426_08655 [Frigidibacter sp. RF13]|uniref:hypothetical protein n=1 Tax=Frigidibacter sp. RF13 TaxID=2997340 RepID=UPI002271524C|nr:hypothetical protein [Frigidibacter sp. RF13]MCY1126922.1 hypothetical protein [Frigidibacter sp. RF13]